MAIDSSSCAWTWCGCCGNTAATQTEESTSDPATAQVLRCEGLLFEGDQLLDGHLGGRRVGPAPDDRETTRIDLQSGRQGLRLNGGRNEGCLQCLDEQVGNHALQGLPGLDRPDLDPLYEVVGEIQRRLHATIEPANQLSVKQVDRLGEVRGGLHRNCIRRLRVIAQCGYGKQVLKAKPKVYLADAAIAPGVLLKGKALLEDPQALGKAVETAFFKHVFTRYYARSVGFSYWRGKNDREVDIIAALDDRLVPFEVKYRGQEGTGEGELKGLLDFCDENNVERGYVITRELTDFQVLAASRTKTAVQLLKIPAPLACYWLGRSEIENANRGDS